MNTTQLRAALLTLAALALPCGLQAQDASKAAPAAAAKDAKPATGPVATVNGVAIPRSRAEELLRMSGAQANNEQVQSALKQRLVDLEVLSQEATKGGVAKNANVQIQLELSRQQVLANAYMGDYIRRNPVSDAEVQSEYEKAKAGSGTKEYHARHILVTTEEEATKLIADVKKGGKFDDLAKAQSKDTGTKERGGDLGWSLPSNYDKVFADAMVKLEKGKLTDAPVRTRFGFHVIRLEDVREFKFPGLTEVKAQIQQQLSQRKLDEHMKGLRSKAKVD